MLTLTLTLALTVTLTLTLTLTLTRYGQGWSFIEGGAREELCVRCDADLG